MMNPEIKSLWLADLRASADLQGQGSLQTADGHFCCFGRLAEVLHLPFHSDAAGGYYYLDQSSLDSFLKYGPPDDFTGGFDAELPASLLSRLSIPPSAEVILISMNDSYEASFHQIADWIEQNL